MKKQLLFVALLSAGLINAKTFDAEAVSSNIKAAMCSARPHFPHTVKALSETAGSIQNGDDAPVKTLVEKLKKNRDMMPHLAKSGALQDLHEILLQSPGVDTFDKVKDAIAHPECR